MSGKQQQFGEQEKRSDTQQRAEGNLGQKAARTEKKNESELAHMGEKSRESGKGRQEK